ncbi:hypothetical protein GCM10011352_28730 [Marinobacterium zhoushanense]|uniref:Na+/proline symporter n=1 Tax=Marinobacterium zhoushanense TaxID=1679163 RepID=A0ABQ1KIY6_9GAMM|nr:hypothetical protein [Marinobacterium zhoushanense]GGC00822.1 hypothetical protein GCM10011352_28730 [Marinobacterium zhoushanense]
MFSPLTVLLLVLIYMGVLFALAQWVEHRIATGRFRFTSRWPYVLSQAVIFTSWTYYGSVGFAAASGLQFMAIYLGTMLGSSLVGVISIRIVRAKEVYRITSIADFIATRYRHSQSIAALVTLIALFGLLPYIALQIKAVTDSLSVIAPGQGGEAEWNMAGLLVTVLMILFTILFGVRRLDPTERHQGMIAALAVECVVKLGAMLIIGGFITFHLFDGPGDIFQQLRQSGNTTVLSPGTGEHAPVDWITLILLGFAGFFCLPRQFHVAVVENSDSSHLRTLIWAMPLYTLLISLFVIPITGAGLLLGIPAEHGDRFMLMIPQLADSQTLTLLSFLGGYAAATGMILITTMTLATMASNHLILPLCERLPVLEALRSWGLQLRWAMVALILGGAYLTALALGQSYILVAMGVISFAAVLQCAPAMLIGLFWRGGNSHGAFWGLACGFALWFYTLVLPAWVAEGWLSAQILTDGPFGIALLRPQHLFGMEIFSPLSHSVFWSLIFNIVAYWLFSRLFHSDKTERRLTDELLECMRGNPVHTRARPTGMTAYIDLEPKITEAQSVLTRYLHPNKVRSTLNLLRENLQTGNRKQITVIELMEFHRMLERLLAGSIGAAAAHSVVANGVRYSEREESDLKALYSHLFSELHPTLENLEESKRDHQAADLSQLIALQRRIEQLERENEQQRKGLDELNQRLDQEYKKAFELRVSEQKLKQENSVLKEQLLREEKGSD